jgi:hypothetical protein
MNSKGRGRKRPWHYLRYYPGMCQGGMSKTTKKHVRIVDVPAEIGIEPLQNTSPKHYSFVKYIGSIIIRFFFDSISLMFMFLFSVLL